MNRASDSRIIATRSWRRSTQKGPKMPPQEAVEGAPKKTIPKMPPLPPWEPVEGASMTVREAAASRESGAVTTAIGRVYEKRDGRTFVVEQFFVFPLSHRPPGW